MKIIQLIGTPFCGSTYFQKLISEKFEIINAGELERLENMQRYSHDPSLYYNIALCNEIYNWSADLCDLVTRATTRNEVYKAFFTQYQDCILLDGSKTPNWFTGECDYDTMYIHICKNPFNFIASMSRKFNTPVWQSAEIWRDINYDALRYRSRLMHKGFQISYEDIILNFDKVVSAINSIFPLKPLVDSNKIELRPLGGNIGVSSFVDDSLLRDIDKEIIKANKSYFSEKGIVDERWKSFFSESDVELILGTPMLVDVSNILGFDMYTLSREAVCISNQLQSHPT